MKGHPYNKFGIGDKETLGDFFLKSILYIYN